MKLDLRRAAPLGLGLLGLAAVFAAFRIYTLDANLKASTGITRKLKADLEQLEAEKRSMADQSRTHQEQIGKITQELEDLRTKDAQSGKRNEELEKLIGDAEKTLGDQNAKVAELEAKLKEAEERLKRQKERNETLAAAREVPGQAGYTKLMESEWLASVAKTEALQKELDGTLTNLADDNAGKTRMQREVATMHYNLAVILTHQGRFDAAVREYERVLEIQPDDPDAHYNLAVLYDTELKDRLKAVEHYRRYVEVSPNSPDAAKVKLWIKDKEFEGRLDHPSLLPKEDKRF